MLRPARRQRRWLAGASGALLPWSSTCPRGSAPRCSCLGGPRSARRPGTSPTACWRACTRCVERAEQRSGQRSARRCAACDSWCSGTPLFCTAQRSAAWVAAVQMLRSPARRCGVFVGGPPPSRPQPPTLLLPPCPCLHAAGGARAVEQVLPPLVPVARVHSLPAGGWWCALLDGVLAALVSGARLPRPPAGWMDGWMADLPLPARPLVASAAAAQQALSAELATLRAGRPGCAVQFINLGPALRNPDVYKYFNNSGGCRKECWGGA